MVTGKNSLGFFLDCVNDQLALVTITVPGSIVDKVYKEIVFSHRSKINTYGFHQSQIPLEYVEQNFKPYLTELVTEFLFKFFVISFLYKKTRAEFIAIAGDPRISDITVEPGQDAQFCFELTLAKTISLHEWKKNVFKSPKRKRYKDIDRQASSFVREESENTKKFSSDMLSPGDWTSFHVKVLDRNNKPIFDTSEHLWLKVGNEEADTPCQETFLGKKIGDTFCTKNPCLQEYFNSQLGIEYNFEITVTDILHQGFFSFDSFKNHFRLKTSKDITKKLTEIYSFRNDISQRRAIINEAIKSLLTNYKFAISQAIIVRQQKNILDQLHENPDYHVYKMEKDFNSTIEKLAKQQVKETVLVDQIAHNESLDISHDEVKNYLNFLNRPRTKDFIYFEAPETKFHGQEFPVSQELLMQTCLREKALNHIIRYLAKK